MTIDTWNNGAVIKIGFELCRYQKRYFCFYFYWWNKTTLIIIGESV